MTTSYTTKLRPLSERMANGVAKTKGYSGTVLAPWRTGKDQVSRWTKTDKGWKNTNQGGTDRALGFDRKANPNVDNNADLSTERSDADKARSAKTARLMENATGVCPTVEPWQNVVVEGTQHSYPKAELTSYYDPRTDQSKPVAYNADAVGHGVSAWYEVERIEGFTHATTEEREEAVREQVKCFGKTGIRRHAKACTKWEKKEQALDNALRLAFNPRPQTAADNALSFDARALEEEESTWTPLTANPLEEMAETETVAWTYKQLEAGLNTLTAKQHMALMERAEGMPQTDRSGQNLRNAQKKVRNAMGL